MTKRRSSLPQRGRRLRLRQRQQGQLQRSGLQWRTLPSCDEVRKESLSMKFQSTAVKMACPCCHVRCDRFSFVVISHKEIEASNDDVTSWFGFASLQDTARSPEILVKEETSTSLPLPAGSVSRTCTLRLHFDLCVFLDKLKKILSGLCQLLQNFPL